MQPFTFFISYRRRESAPVALLLKNEIEKRMQFVRVFIDVHEMRVGEEFPERLKHSIAESHATIALIGEHWMPKTGAAPQPDSVDWVQCELEYSLSLPLPPDDRHGLQKRVVIPLFVDCPRQFGTFQLPPSLQPLSLLHAEEIHSAGWPSSIGPLLEKIAVRLGLKERPDADRYPPPDPAKARTQPVADEELAKILAYDAYQGWYIDNFGNNEARYLVKTFKFPHFNQAADFMATAANHCRVLGHHPEWRNVFDEVTVSLTTWDARRRITIYDLNLALFMNMAANTIAGKQP